MMTSSMRRYLRQQYGTDDVKLLQKTLHVEAGDTADSRAKAAGMARSPGAIRAPKSKTGTLEDTFRRQIKSGVKGMSASESLPALMRTGGSSRKQHTASASQLPTLSAKTSETNGVPLKLRENPFGAAHYTKPKDERKREALRAILFKKLMARYANRISPAHRAAQLIVAEIDSALDGGDAVSADTVRRVEKGVKDQIAADPDLHLLSASQALGGAGGAALRAAAARAGSGRGPGGVSARSAASRRSGSGRSTDHGVHGAAPREGVDAMGVTGTSALGSETAALLADLDAPTLNRSYGAAQAHLVHDPIPKKLVGGKLVNQSEFLNRTGQGAAAAQEAQWLLIQRARDLKAVEAEMQATQNKHEAAERTRRVLAQQMEEHAAAKRAEAESARRYLDTVMDKQSREEAALRRKAQAAKEKSQHEAEERLAQVASAQQRRRLAKEREQTHERDVMQRTQARVVAANTAAAEARVHERQALREFLSQNEALRESRREAMVQEQQDDKALMEQYAELLEKQERARVQDLHSREEKLQKTLTNMKETYESQQAKRDAEAALVQKYQEEREAALAAREEREAAARRRAQAKLYADLEEQRKAKAASASAAKDASKLELQQALEEERRLTQKEMDAKAHKRQAVLAERQELLAQMAEPRVSEEGMTPRTSTMNAREVQEAMQYLSGVGGDIVHKADTVKRTKGGLHKDNLTLKRTTGGAGESLLL